MIWPPTLRRGMLGRIPLKLYRDGYSRPFDSQQHRNDALRAELFGSMPEPGLESIVVFSEGNPKVRTHTSKSPQPQTRLELGDLPVELLIEFAVREGRRPRPIYQMHRWFARRLPSVFRTVLIAASNTKPVDWETAYYEPPNLTGKRILDPFVGGGTSILEANRMGADVLGRDIDPVACFITQQQMKAKSIPDLQESLSQLQKRVETKLADYYKLDGRDREGYLALHFFWVQVVRCSACNRDQRLHHNHILAQGNPNWLICPRCEHVFDTTANVSRRCRCAKCKYSFFPMQGSVAQGVAQCDCGSSYRLIDKGRLSRRPPRWRMIAIEAIPVPTDRRTTPLRERIFFSVRRSDRKNVRIAQQALEDLLKSDPTAVPETKILLDELAKDKRLYDYGYRKWSELFNPRQLLHLALLSREIKKLPQELRLLHSLAFSNHLATNCMLTSYASGWRRLTPLFGIRGFRHVNRPVELNPWLSRTGRGTYPNAVRQLERGREFIRSPKEPDPSNGFRSVVDASPGRYRVSNADSTALRGLKSSSVDLVISDPPYFDNIVYSELSEFYRVWLEHLGSVSRDQGHTETKSKSLISTSRSFDESSVFAKGLSKAFASIERVLKPSGIFAFTYRHSTANGWHALNRSLSESNMEVVQVVPVPGEAGSGLHNHPGTNLWDALLVLRPNNTARQNLSISSLHLARLRKHLKYWTSRLESEQRLPFGEEARLNFFRACLVGSASGFLGDSRTGRHNIEELIRKASE